MLSDKYIKLAPIAEHDLEQTRSWANDIKLNFDILRVLPVSEPEQRLWYENLCHDPSRIVFTVKTIDEGVHIGNAGLYHIDYLHRRAEFWMLIGNEKYRGMGFGSEIFRLMLRFGFNFVNLNRLYLYVRRDNSCAIAVYNKFNMIEEGILRQHYFIQGHYVDVLIMSLLREEYDPNQ